MTDSSTVTGEICAWAAGLRFADLPEAALRRAALAIADLVGCALAGAGTATVDAVAAAMAEDGGAPQATLFGRAERLPAPAAALVNAVSGHAYDFDDISSAMYGHPSTVLVPALFAVGEKRAASGRALLTAYVAGFEAAARIGRRLNPAHYRAGWHSTSTVGALAAAVAVARLEGLAAEPMRVALSLAASQMAGLQRQFGSDAKPLQAGFAARAGVTAAALAAHGVSADGDILDGERGVLALYGDGGARPAEEGLAILDSGIQVKRHACCAATHSAIDAALELMASHRLEPGEIERVECEVNQIAADVLRYAAPATPLEAKFSLQHCVAAALRSGGCGLGQFSQAAVEDPAQRALAARVALTVDPALPPFGTTPCRMTIRMSDGRTLVARVESPKGSAARPLAEDELRRKFLDCAALRRCEAEPAAIFDAVAALAQARDVRDVAALTRRPARTKAVHA